LTFEEMREFLKNKKKGVLNLETRRVSKWMNNVPLFLIICRLKKTNYEEAEIIWYSGYLVKIASIETQSM